MIAVKHPKTVPPQLAREQRANPNPPDPSAAWDALAGKEEISSALKPAQNQLCPYCEESLATWGCHIDHIVPKSIDPAGTFKFDNLVLCCIESSQLAAITEGTSCGHFRQSAYDPVLFIKPVEADGVDCFSCDILTGKLRPMPGLPKQKLAGADYMIRTLNLNCFRLNRRRRDWIAAILKQVGAMGAQADAVRWFLQDCFAAGKPFVSVVREYFGNL